MEKECFLFLIGCTCSLQGDLVFKNLAVLLCGQIVPTGTAVVFTGACLPSLSFALFEAKAEPTQQDSTPGRLLTCGQDSSVDVVVGL